jgi:hypothetical protein
VQFDAPVSLYVPASQLLHTAESPTDADALPAGQLAQLSVALE